MAALTGPRNTPELADGGRMVLVPVEASTSIHLGGMVALNAAGNAVAAAKTAGLITMGRAEYVYTGGMMPPGIDALNQSGGAALFPQIPSLGAAGAISIGVRKGVFKYDNDGSITAANVGQPCFAADDHTVSADSLAVAQAPFTIPASLIQQLAHWPVAIGSVLVQNNAKSTTYVEHTDYWVDYQGGIITYEGGTLVSTVVVQVGYSYHGGTLYSSAGRIVQVDSDGVWVDFWRSGSSA
jgi:hypothetical protein